MTLWEIDIHPAPEQPDLLGQRVVTEAADLGLGQFEVHAARGFLIQGEISADEAQRLARELIADLVVEIPRVGRPGEAVLSQFPASGGREPAEGDRLLMSPSAATSGDLRPPLADKALIHVLPKPGVTDPVAASTLAAITDFGIAADSVVTLRKYWVSGLGRDKQDLLATKLLANDSIEQVIFGPLKLERLELGSPYEFQPVNVSLRGLNEQQLVALSQERTLSLTLVELKTIQQHYRDLSREPTDIELETIAQTWSEHCSHKTLAGRVNYTDENGNRQFDNLLKETIFAATQKIRQQLGADDWCVSVFRDNAGIVRFDDNFDVAFKVETHNRPSAIEPYGGANTGVGGVIRDTLGTGLGAKPVCNTDVFCFAPPDTPADELPPGVLHPRRIMRGVVSGVRDYGNRMGIPTVNGAIYFDTRYVGNPLVFCGNVGLVPRDKSFKQPQPGDLIVAVGGRTGRDGIHGATFSSAELTHESDKTSGGAVQIGNAITEKMVLDVLLKARDEGLYSAVTDCGAGGFSSAVGEMGAEIGAEVWLEKAPLKYDGLSYTEIWISEAQERMVMAVPETKWLRLEALCQSENVEATVIGRFPRTGKLELKYEATTVGHLDMHLLHEGRPKVERQATYKAAIPKRTLDSRALDYVAEQLGVDKEKITPETLNDLSADSLDSVELVMELEEEFGVNIPKEDAERIRTIGQAIEYIQRLEGESPNRYDYNQTLFKLLSSLNIAGKEWVIRQYDHEVQGGSVIKPLVGAANDGPSDAAVLRPVLASRRGLVIACGMNPRYGDYDPYHMAACAIDEAVRNCVAVGADPRRIAILDNFCWGYTDRPETLGALVRAALACHDVAVAYGTPFISGKDSLNNEFSYERQGERRTIQIPHTLLISALGQVDDVGRCVTMDLKSPGHLLYQVGSTKAELGGSHFDLIVGRTSDCVPKVDTATAKRTFHALHQAIDRQLVRACHDLSEGGLAVAMAEMAFAGGCGATLRLSDVPHDVAQTSTSELNVILLFSESASRFLVEVPPDACSTFEAILRQADVPLARIGEVTSAERLVIAGVDQKPAVDQSLADLKEAWQRPLRW